MQPWAFDPTQPPEAYDPIPDNNLATGEIGDRLVAAYSFAGQFGRVAWDASGMGCNATLAGDAMLDHRGLVFSGNSGCNGVVSRTPDLVGNWAYHVMFTRSIVGTSSFLPIVNRMVSTSAGRQLFVYVHKDTNKVCVDVPYIKAIMVSNTTISVGVQYALTVSRVGNVWSIYINGVLDNSVVDSTAQETSSASLLIGGSGVSGAAGWFPGLFNYMYITMGMTADAAQRLSASPYALWQPPMTSLYTILTSGGIARDLSGTIAGSSSVSAALAARRALAGSSAGQGTLTDAQLRAIRALSGASAGAAVVGDAALNARRGLSGAVSGSSLISDAALAARRGLAGVVVGASSVEAAAVRIARSLSGSATGSAAVAGHLAALRTFSGSVDGLATLVGELVILQPSLFEGALTAGPVTQHILRAGTIEQRRMLAGEIVQHYLRGDRPL